MRMWLLAAGALVALAAWPAFVASRSAAPPVPLATPAPVQRDDLTRGKVIAFYERRMRAAPGDGWIARMAAAQYLQRYREHGDAGDLDRAERAARRSLAVLPYNNAAAQQALASVYLAKHEFRRSLAMEEAAAGRRRGEAASTVRIASLELEIGNVAKARGLLASLPFDPYENVARDTVQARYDELTGKLSQARVELARATIQLDSMIDAPAENRAWYHFRAGELAFEAGATDEAVAQQRRALEIYPTYPRAYGFLARVYGATHRWPDALEAATRASDLLPQPDSLGYKFDAQKALGDERGAAETLAEIDAVAKLGGPRINDRLLAQFYSEHGLHQSQAFTIAKRDLAVRDDVFAEDTLAGCAIALGRWDVARIASRKATANGTEDARIWYHAGLIARHDGNTVPARRWFAKALALNAQFHPFYAAEARRLASADDVRTVQRL